MSLSKLHLQHFRNLTDVELEFPRDRPVLIVGDNGAGKTNILEAIHTLALGKGIRTGTLASSIAWAEDPEQSFPHFRLTATIADEDDQELSFFFGVQGRARKQFQINGVTTEYQDYIGQLLVVPFTPVDLHMIHSGPQSRRSLINRILCQTSREYFVQLSQYHASLKQRNKLLKQIQEGKASESHVEVWDHQLAQSAAVIIHERQVFLREMGQDFADAYRQISEGLQLFEVSWKKDYEQETVEELNAYFFDYLVTHRRRDVRAGSTCGGPHRNDLIFMLDGHELQFSGSRGECRTALIAFKLSEISWIHKSTGRKPLLMLDDVFSELDLHRQQALLSCLRGYQTLLTTTHVDFEIPDACVWKVKDGSVETTSL